MKITPFLLAVVSVCALTVRPAFAAEPSGEASKSESRENQKNGAHSVDSTHGSLLPGKKVPLVGNRSLSQVNASKKIGQAAPVDIQPKRNLANGLPQTGLNKTSPTAKTGLTMNRSGNPLLAPSMLPTGRATTLPTTHIVRDRVATTASVGGLAALSLKNSPTPVNGAAVKRKP
jgi:hypothetical protein